MKPVVTLSLVAFCQADEQQHHVGLLCRAAGILDQAFVGLIGCLVVTRCIQYADARVEQAVKGGIELCGVDQGAARALIAGRAGHFANDSHGLTGLERQEIFFVFQQYHGFARNFPREAVIRLMVAGVGIGLCLLSAADQVKNLVHALIEQGFVNFTCAHRVDDLLIIQAAGGGHFEILPRNKAGDAFVIGAPVCDDEAFEAPVPAQHVGQQPFVFGAEGAVDLVVCAHDRPRLGLFDGYFKRGEIDFAQRAFVHNRIDLHAARFLIVARKMLERGAHALFLHAVDKGRAHLSCEQRVLGEIFKIASAQGRALDIDAGAEHHAHALRKGLLRDRAAHFMQQLRVPGAGGRGSRWEAGGGFAAVDAEIVLAAGLLAQAVRAVADHNLRDVEVFKPLQMPEILAGAKACLFLQRHLADQILMFHLSLLPFLYCPKIRKRAAIRSSGGSSVP